MNEAAEAQRFEEAARYRNRLFAVRHLAERQAADKKAIGTVDVLGLAVRGEQAAGVDVHNERGGTDFENVDLLAFHWRSRGRR